MDDVGLKIFFNVSHVFRPKRHPIGQFACKWPQVQLNMAGTCFLAKVHSLGLHVDGR